MIVEEIHLLIEWKVEEASKILEERYKHLSKEIEEKHKIKIKMIEDHYNKIVEMNKRSTHTVATQFLTHVLINLKIIIKEAICQRDNYWIIYDYCNIKYYRYKIWSVLVMENNHCNIKYHIYIGFVGAGYRRQSLQ